jgi:GT2 family glycosyltransferase
MVVSAPRKDRRRCRLDSSSPMVGTSVPSSFHLCPGRFVSWLGSVDCNGGPGIGGNRRPAHYGTALTTDYISVVIATSDRPADLDRCLTSLAAVRYPAWELVIVDQSRDDRVRQVVDRWRARSPALTYEHLDRRNASEARNRGTQSAQAPILAYIDDDCTVESGWLDDVAGAFARHPSCGMVYGSVRGVAVDPRKFFVPTWEFAVERVLAGPKAMIGLRGMGASMYVRREAFEDAGGFDPLLGPGARFRGCQDDDLTYRVLAHGWPVLETPSISVCHHGARAYADGSASRLSRNYHFGTGALHMKMLRCSQPGALPVALHKLWHRASDLKPLEILAGRPTKFGALLSFVLGMAASFGAPVDHRRLQYVQTQAIDLQSPEMAPTRLT